DAASWRTVFWINVPLAAVALLMIFRHVPESRSAKRERIDWLGAARGALCLGALTYAGTRWPETDGRAPDVLGAIAVGIVAAVVFVVVERRVQSPLLPPEMFRSRDFSGLNVMTL